MNENHIALIQQINTERGSERVAIIKQEIYKTIERANIILIDTCSLMEPSFPLFMENYAETLKELNKKIVITSNVCMEIAKHLDSKEHPEKSQICLDLMPYLDKYNKFGVLEISNKQLSDDEYVINKAFADNQLLKELHNPHICQILITQDTNLAEDAEGLNKLKSSGYIVHIYKISSKGFLTRIPRYKENVIKESESDKNSIVLDKNEIESNQIQPTGFQPIKLNSSFAKSSSKRFNFKINSAFVFSNSPSSRIEAVNSEDKKESKDVIQNEINQKKIELEEINNELVRTREELKKAKEELNAKNALVEKNETSSSTAKDKIKSTDDKVYSKQTSTELKKDICNIVIKGIAETLLNPTFIEKSIDVATFFMKNK